MKNNLFKKSMSVFLTALMLMTCWVFMPATHEHLEADAAALESASSLYNKSLLNGINTNVDYNVNTTGNYYKFKIYGKGDDGNDNTTERQQKYYKNLLSHDAEGTNGSLVGDQNRGSYFTNVTNSELTVTIAYPTMVLKYDGVTTPKFGIMLEADAAKKKKISFKRAWMDANSNGLSFNPNYWSGISKDDSAYFYCMDAAPTKQLYAQDTSNGDQFSTRSNGQWEFTAASLEFKGSMSVGEWVRTISPTWKFDNGSTTYTGTNNSYIYVMNFKGYGELLTQINNKKTELLNNAAQYTTDSIKTYVDAAKAITNLNPKNYTAISSVTSWGNQMNTAYTNYNNAVNGLKNREYEVTYDNMFSLADWRYSQSLGDANYVSVNLNEGKVTIINPNTSEFTTPMSGSSSNANTRDTSFYAMPVVGGQEYTIKYTTDCADTQMFAFFYDKNGGCTHSGTYGNYNFAVRSGTDQATFKAPDNSTQMEIRFDNNIKGTANFWDIMIYPAAVKTENEVDSWTARPHRQLYAYNASVGTLQTPVRPGYIFGGWKEDTDGDGIGDAAAPTGAITSTRVLYSTWTPGTMDVGYDNLFSVSAWGNAALGAKTNQGGTITVDADNGTISIENPANAASNDNNYTPWTYAVPVDAGKEYIFVYDTDIVGATGTQIHIFYKTSAESTTWTGFPNSPYVKTEGHKEKNTIVFTVPEGTTHLSFRFGTTDGAGMTNTFSDIGLYEKAAYDAYAKDYAKVREPFIIGDTKNLMTPTRAGYVFDGWELENGDKITTVAGLTANTTVYAAWTKEHTVTYYYGDNTTVLATVKVKDGETVGALPTVTPTKETTAEYSYEFESWKANDAAFTASTTVTSDLKVYPVFKNVPHTFVWAANPYKNATCDDPALVGKSCSGCGYSLGNVPYDGDNANWLAKGHDYSRGEILENSSTGNTDNDTHSIKCARYSTCGSVQLVKHTWSGDTSVGATCTTPGTIKKTCPCGAEKFVDGEIDATAHNFDYTVGTPNGDNKTHTVKCTYDYTHTKSVACEDNDNNCLCDICKQELIHVYDKKTKTFEASEADCYNDATYYYTCQCGKKGTETWTDVGSKLQHNWTNTEKYLKSGADCENDEVYYKECSRCHISSENETNATWTKADTAKGHDYTGDTRNNNDGTHSYLCKNDCGTYGYDKVKEAATDCTYGEWTKTEADTHTKTCTECTYAVTEDHSFTNWVTVDGATNTAAAEHTRECTVCGRTETTDCTYTSVETKVTCTTDGYTTHTCDICKHVYVTPGTTATGHDYTGAVQSLNNGTHNYLCKNECGTYGYDGVENNFANCDYKYENDAADGEHQAICKECGYNFAEDCSGGQATCTAAAVCEKCNVAYGTTVPHSFEGAAVVLEGDFHAYLCEFCGDTTGIKGVGSTVDAKEACSGGTATCIALAVCDKCKDTHGELAAHVYNGDAVKLDGDVHAYRCSVCKNNALYGVGNEDNKTEACSGGKATCTDLAVCTVCNDTHGELDKDAHKWGSWANVEGTETHKRLCEYNNAHTEIEDCFSPDIVVIAPDCETPGYTLNTCEICTHEWHTAPTEPLGHDWSAWVNNNNGTHTRTCQDETCKYGENGGAKVETADCTKANADAVVTEPTCTEGGYTTYTCKDCGYVWKADATAATGHSYEKQTRKTDSKYQRSTKDCVTDWTYWYCCDNCDVSAETEKDKYPDAVLYWVREAAAGHKFDAKTATEAYIATAATCTAKATYYYSCSVCGTSSKETAQEKTFEHGAALDHDWQNTETFKKSDADCINNEVYYKECSRCHISSENETGATWEKAYTKSGHDFEDGYTAGVAATCTEDGVVEHYTCNVCKKHFNADKTKEIAADKLTIAALKHDFKDIAAKAATCEESGYTKHKQCQREGCGYRNTDYEVIPAKGHEFKAANGYYTDKDNNKHAYYCTNNCGTYGIGNVKNATVDCVFDGEYVQYDDENGIHSHKKACVCGNEQSAACADATPERVAPTCTEDGYYVHVCDVCSYEWTVASDAEEDKASGHSLKVVSNNDGTHSKVCENNCGYEERAEKCSTVTPATNCGERDVCDICKTAFGEAKPHVFTNYVSNNDAKCGIDGTKTAVCDTCTGEDKATDTITDVGSALDHEMTEFGYSIDDWKFAEGFSEDIAEPTCKAEGLAVSYCENCNHYETQFVPKNENHSFGEWASMGGSCATGITYRRTCEYCGEAETKIEYDVEHDLVLKVSKAATCTEDSIELYRCKNCGYSEETHETKAKGHTWGEPIEDKAATCKNPGRAFKYCSVCGASEKVTLPQLVHAWDKNNDGLIDSGFTPDAADNSYIYVAATDATCSADGYEGYFKCLDCSYDQHLDARWLAISGNYKPATGHVDKDGDGECDGKGCNKTFGDSSSSSGDCGCICHKTNWFSKIIYKILRFFWKIFGIGKACDCGTVHY